VVYALAFNSSARCPIKAQFAILLSLFPLLPAIARAQSTHPEGVEQLLANLYADAKFNGNVVIVDHSRVVLQRSYGFANLKEQRLLDLDAAFQIASISKQFTAAGILLLRDEGKLELDQSVSELLPGYPFRGVTIRHLLTHTSGMPAFEENVANGLEKTRVNGNGEIFALLRSGRYPARAEPGVAWEYSDMGYDMLANVIERLSQLSYREFMQRRVFVPLGMKRTTSASTDVDKRPVTDLAMGYTRVGERFELSNHVEGNESAFYTADIVGDGSIYSTVRDLQRWDEALAKGTLLRPESLKEAWTAARLADGRPAATSWGDTHYGFGWEIVEESPFGRIVRHGGGQPGYRASIQRFLDRGVTFIVLCNLDTDDFWTYSPRLAEAYFGLKPQ
jgi:CubicO group peptidase (beta-lactamase class C family)